MANSRRYFEWNYFNNTWREFERLGSCNRCGDCCRARIEYYVPGLPPQARKGESSHMGTGTNQQGVWYEVEIDGQRFFAACRQGLVHVTWVRVTLRFTREEFRRLAMLLQRCSDTQSPGTFHDGSVRVTCRNDEDNEVRLGQVVLLLSPEEFQSFSAAAQKALESLDKIISSGVWDQQEEDEAGPTFLDSLRRIPFSRN